MSRELAGLMPFSWDRRNADKEMGKATLEQFSMVNGAALIKAGHVTRRTVKQQVTPDKTEMAHIEAGRMKRRNRQESSPGQRQVKRRRLSQHMQATDGVRQQLRSSSGVCCTSSTQQTKANSSRNAAAVGARHQVAAGDENSQPQFHNAQSLGNLSACVLGIATEPYRLSDSVVKLLPAAAASHAPQLVPDKDVSPQSCAQRELLPDGQRQSLNNQVGEDLQAWPAVLDVVSGAIQRPGHAPATLTVACTAPLRVPLRQSEELLGYAYDPPHLYAFTPSTPARGIDAAGSCKEAAGSCKEAEDEEPNCSEGHCLGRCLGSAGGLAEEPLLPGDRPVPSGASNRGERGLVGLHTAWEYWRAV